jgi:hypothetical protein
MNEAAGARREDRDHAKPVSFRRCKIVTIAG